MGSWMKRKLPGRCLAIEKFQERDLFNGISLRYCLKFIAFPIKPSFWFYGRPSLQHSTWKSLLMCILVTSFPWLLWQPYPLLIVIVFPEIGFYLIMISDSRSDLGVSLCKEILNISIQTIRYWSYGLPCLKAVSFPPAFLIFFFFHIEPYCM